MLRGQLQLRLRRAPAARVCDRDPLVGVESRAEQLRERVRGIDADVVELRDDIARSKAAGRGGSTRDDRGHLLPSGRPLSTAPSGVTSVVVAPIEETTTLPVVRICWMSSCTSATLR